MFFSLRKKQDGPLNVHWLLVQYMFMDLIENTFFFQVYGHNGGHISYRITRTLLIRGRRFVFRCLHNDNGVYYDIKCICTFKVISEISAK
jgi:hypothetical protein